MPTYIFHNTITNEVEEHFMSYKDLDTFKEECPHLQQQITAPNVIGGTGDRVKTDAGFKEVLSKVGENYKGSPLDRRYNKMDIKTQKTKEIVKKHIDKQQKK